MYTANQVAHFFSIARETVRKWAIEFEPHLSPSANPGKERQRIYSEDDVAVFALVKEMKGQGKLYSDIHAALVNGQRGELPPDAYALAAVDTPRAMSLQREVERLQAALLIAVDSDRRSAVENELLRGQIATLEDKIDRLNREIGRLESRIDPSEK
jgi:DNA-binding transcriptional MerR regulator